MINMIKVKKIFDENCWIIKFSLLRKTSEFVIRCCFNAEDDGTICKGEEDDNIEDWFLFGELNRFDDVEYNFSVHKLFWIVEVWDKENIFELKVLFNDDDDDEIIGRISRFNQRQFLLTEK